MSNATCALLCAVVCLVGLAPGCGADAELREAANEGRLDLEDLETRIAMPLPADTVLLNAWDGKDRAPSGYYCWVLFSPTGFRMPPRQEAYIEDYIPVTLDTAVKAVEASMGKKRRKIRQPQESYCSTWHDEDYTFRGTVIRAASGEYLEVSRFSKH